MTSLRDLACASALGAACESPTFEWSSLQLRLVALHGVNDIDSRINSSHNSSKVAGGRLDILWCWTAPVPEVPAGVLSRHDGVRATSGPRNRFAQSVKP
ncbi:MAG: hypothetical protein HIU84_07645 [Acidobacteria bacterium]|nr:hypothetical protein [Acidobacteriota bacterium]